ncbi:MAG: GHKL domain-containing protein [Lachnospiraceae bacterium]|nr:GHKL domain-containing protein [Lachnospiraceae bacterium]
MALIIYVLADIIHLVKILVLCNMFFALQKREGLYNKWMIMLAGCVMAITSVFIFIHENYIIETLIYAIVIIGLIFMLYSEKPSRVVIVAVGIILGLSMIDTMTGILFNVTMELFSINGEILSNLVASLISCIMIYFVGKVYQKNAVASLNSIGVANLIGFIILLAVDTFVVTVIETQPNADLYTGSRRSLYLVSIVFVIIGIFIQLAAVILLFTQRNVYKEKKELTDRYLNEQKNHYEYLENREKETKKFRHDLKSHMELISNLAKERQYERMNAYLEQMDIKIDGFGKMVTVQNGIVDAIINQYYAKAGQCGVSMEVKGRFPVDCTIDAFDLCTIFSNVLSNALEAAVETEEKYISVECAYTDVAIMIIVSNSYKPDATNGGGQWRTRKSDLDYHGYGLENIKDSVKKYKGDLDIETKDNIFNLRILFQNMEKQIDENSNCG